MAAACAPAMETPRITKVTTKRIGAFVRAVLYYSDGTKLNTLGPNKRVPGE
jgi:hypothetical protein